MSERIFFPYLPDQELSNEPPFVPKGEERGRELKVVAQKSQPCGGIWHSPAVLTSASVEVWG